MPRKIRCAIRKVDEREVVMASVRCSSTPRSSNGISQGLDSVPAGTRAIPVTYCGGSRHRTISSRSSCPEITVPCTPDTTWTRRIKSSSAIRWASLDACVWAYPAGRARDPSMMLARPMRPGLEPQAPRRRARRVAGGWLADARIGHGSYRGRVWQIHRGRMENQPRDVPTPCSER